MDAGPSEAIYPKTIHKDVSERRVSEYMKRWGLSCQRLVKRARKQDPKRV